MRNNEKVIVIYHSTKKIECITNLAMGFGPIFCSLDK